MNGDLSIAPPAAAMEVAPRTRAASSSATRPVAEPTLLHAVPPAATERHEASRLKALLTDPAMRVSTHQDDASGRVVLQVQDRATGEMVEQIPSDRLLKLFATMREALVDEQA